MCLSAGYKSRKRGQALAGVERKKEIGTMAIDVSKGIILIAVVPACRSGPLSQCLWRFPHAMVSSCSPSFSDQKAKQEATHFGRNLASAEGLRKCFSTESSR